MMKKINISVISALFSLLLFLPACDDSKSYSELLKEEEQAVNWYLANNKVEITIPENSEFETGENAPYYKMDKDGFVYMQVINPGDMENRPRKGDLVYFRFMRKNVKYMAEGASVEWEGNADDMDPDLGSTSLIYGNKVLQSTTQYGDGLQVPLDYLGYNCEVNLVIKSPEGFTSSASQCTPYLYNVRYFKAEY